MEKRSCVIITGVLFALQAAVQVHAMQAASSVPDIPPGINQEYYHTISPNDIRPGEEALSRPPCLSANDILKKCRIRPLSFNPDPQVGASL